MNILSELQADIERHRSNIAIQCSDCTDKKCAPCMYTAVLKDLQKTENNIRRKYGKQII
jgi:hypothetical protein